MLSTRGEVLSLYRHLLRICSMLDKKGPDGAGTYYRQFARAGFESHRSEDDEERIRHMVHRTYDDAKWIADKYNLPSVGEKEDK